MKRIITRKEFTQLASELGVRNDWHEPDEQKVTAQVYGDSFDNAGFWPMNARLQLSLVERYVVLYRDHEPVACVNLATLCAWASGYDS